VDWNEMDDNQKAQWLSAIDSFRKKASNDLRKIMNKADALLEEAYRTGRAPKKIKMSPYERFAVFGHADSATYNCRFGAAAVGSSVSINQDGYTHYDPMSLEYE
jgi:hypothetical protein